MTAKNEQPNVDDTIRLALEAASAANDAAGEIEGIRSDSKLAAERTEAFRKRITTVVLGALGGAVVAMTLGSLVYFRTISEMRKANATQIEALAMFADSVDELTTNLESVQSLAEELQGESETIAAATKELHVSVENTRANLVEDLRSFAEEAGAMQPEIAQTINEHINQKFESSNEATMSALGDLLEALSGQVSEGSVDGGMDTATQALIEQIILLQEQQKATQDLIKSSASRPAPAPSRSSSSSRSASSAPKPNPFSYP